MRLLAGLILIGAGAAMVFCAVVVYRGAAPWFAIGIPAAAIIGSLGAAAVYERATK